MVTNAKYSFLCSTAKEDGLPPPPPKNEQTNKKQKISSKHRLFFSHNKVLRRSREANEFNTDTGSQMKEANQILTKEKHPNRVKYEKSQQ